MCLGFDRDVLFGERPRYGSDGPSDLDFCIESDRLGERPFSLDKVGTRPSLECRRFELDRKKLGMRDDPHRGRRGLSSSDDRGLRDR